MDVKENVLITGNLGYVGSVLINEIDLNKYNVTGLDLGWFENLLTSALPQPRINQVFKDLRDLKKEDLIDIDHVVHLAAVSNDPMGKEFEEATYEINLEASKALAKLCSDMNVKTFTFASSCSVYGAGGDKPKKETDELNPLTAYAKSKILFEEELEKISKESEMIITSLRFSTACGPSPRLRLDLVVNDFVASAISENHIEILSDGSPLRPLIDTRDMSRAIFWALERENYVKDKYVCVNVGMEENNFRVKDLAELVKEAVGDVAVSINTDAAPDKRSYAVDFSLFQEMAPDHQPRYSMKNSIDGLLKLMQEENIKINEFRSGLLMRHNQLRNLKHNKILDNFLRLE